VADNSQTLVNGQATSEVAVQDRGLAYGDGVFRTLRIEAGQPRWWTEQLRKLASDCSRLDLICPSATLLEADLARLSLPETGVLRITVTRGMGPRGYSGQGCEQSTRIVTVWPGHSNDVVQPGIQVRVCRLRLGHQPALAGVKHLNRLENVLARREWQDPAVGEGILLDQTGHVISGVMSNLFLWQENRLCTPKLDLCGVAGVARARLMERAEKAGYRVEETVITLADVFAADELMFTNSLMGLQRVHCMENRVWGDPVVSGALRSLLDA